MWPARWEGSAASEVAIEEGRIAGFAAARALGKAETGASVKQEAEIS